MNPFSFFRKKSATVGYFDKNELSAIREKKVTLFHDALDNYHKKNFQTLTLKGSRKKIHFMVMDDFFLEKKALLMFIDNRFSAIENFLDAYSEKQLKKMKKSGDIVFMPTIEKWLSQVIDDFSLKVHWRNERLLELPITWNNKKDYYEITPDYLLLLQIRKHLLRETYMDFYEVIEQKLSLSELLNFDNQTFALLITPDYVQTITKNCEDYKNITELLKLPESNISAREEDKVSFSSNHTAASDSSSSSVKSTPR